MVKLETKGKLILILLILSITNTSARRQVGLKKLTFVMNMIHFK